MYPLNSRACHQHSHPLPTPQPFSPGEGFVHLFNSIYSKHVEHLGHWEEGTSN